MKNSAKWIVKLVVTLGLFFLIFTEIGEKYVSVPRVWIEQQKEDLFFRQGKRFLSIVRGKPSIEPASFNDLCSLDTKHSYLIQVPFAEQKILWPVDIDLHCGEGQLSRIFIRIQGKESFRNVPFADTEGIENVYVKTRGWWRVAPVQPRDLWREVRNLNMRVFWFWILFASLVKTIGVFASLGRWTVLLKGQRIKLPFRYLAGTFFVGRFFGMFLPSTLGLDGYRLYDSIRQTRRPVECTAVIAVEKLIGFVALFSLVFLTLPLYTHVLPFKNPGLLLGILAFLACFITFVLLLLFWPKLATTLFRIAPIPFKQKFQKKIDEVVAATTAYAESRATLSMAIILGFIVHIGTIFMYFGTMRSIIATNVGIVDIFFASPLMITGTVFGPTIGGEGIREFVFTYLLGPKAGAAKAFLLGHLGFWIGEFLLSIPGGIVYLLRPAGYRPKLTTEDLAKVKDQSL